MSKLGCNLRKSPGSVGSGKPSWGGKAPHLAEKGGALGSAERAGGGGARRQTTSPPTRHLTLAGVGSGALRPLIFSEIVHLGVRRPTNDLGTDLGSQSLCRHMATGDKYSCLSPLCCCLPLTLQEGNFFLSTRPVHPCFCSFAVVSPSTGNSV